LSSGGDQRRRKVPAGIPQCDVIFGIGGCTVRTCRDGGEGDGSATELFEQDCAATSCGEKGHCGGGVGLVVDVDVAGSGGNGNGRAGEFEGSEVADTCRRREGDSRGGNQSGAVDGADGGDGRGARRVIGDWATDGQTVGRIVHREAAGGCDRTECCEEIRIREADGADCADG